GRLRRRRRCAPGGGARAGAQRCQSPLERATPCGGGAGSRGERRSRKRCALGAGEAARARPASAGPSPCAPRSRLLPGATGPARRRTVGAKRQSGAKTRAHTAQAVAAGCRTQGCDQE
uniref:Uncharacterized protein n=1 Tax=Sus scrofa TaxID=9823 RepID=A0A8D0UXW4_PIG